jgi:hypothetical protein
MDTVVRQVLYIAIHDALEADQPPQRRRKVPRLTLVAADVERDEISIRLVGDEQGPVEITLQGDSSTRTWSPGSKAAGPWTFSSSPKELVEGQYTKLIVKWLVPSDAPSMLEQSVDVSFRVLGWVHHTQYNTPHESACHDGFGIALFESVPRACDFGAGTVKRPDFIKQTYINGTGVSDVTANSDLMAAETKCVFQDNTFYRTRPPIVGAFNIPIDNTSVAIRLLDSEHPERGFNHFLKKQDRILIVGYGSAAGTIKNVVDSCPACKDDPDYHIDNYTSSAACYGVPDLPGEDWGWFFTIRLR